MFPCSKNGKPPSEVIKDLDRPNSATPYILGPKESNLVYLSFGFHIRKLEMYTFVCRLIHSTIFMRTHSLYAVDTAEIDEDPCCPRTYILERRETKNKQ